MTFAPGVLRSHAGPELVLLDANDDLNVYLVSTSYDGFSHPIASAATTDTGVDLNYFFGGQGPTTYRVFGTTIDLSSWNIPEGQTVDQVQLFTEGPSCDPLALGVLLPPQQLPPISHWGLVAAGLLLLVSGARAAVRRPPVLRNARGKWHLWH